MARPMPRPPPVTTTVLLILVLVVSPLGVVPGILLEIGQRLERAHPIEKQDTVKMIVLVLDDTGRKVLQLEFEALAGAIESGHLDVLGPRHSAADLGNAQAAFPAL